MFGIRAAALVCLFCLAQTPAAPQTAPLGALAKMPVREITVFKDGHAFVLHEGRLPTDAAGEVRMDYLPTPVLGTFWPYSADKNVKLRAVTAGQRRVLVPRTALTLRELIEANPGAPVGIEEISGPGYGAQIVGVPTRSARELEATFPPNSGDKLPEKANLVLLKTVTGTTAVPFERIQKVTFTERMEPTLQSEEFRSLLTLKLDWPAGRIGKTADVGMLYLQRGVRWIPGYKASIDGRGGAAVQLQATLLNELTDLENVTVHLVIGVPSFDFRDTPDPIGLQETLAQLSPYFGRDARTSNAFSNAIMSQAGGVGGFRGNVEPARPPGPEVAGADRSEDLFVFTVKNVTLKKGERMVLPVAEYRLAYQDVYTLELPFAPPRELTESYNTEQQAQWARLLAAPKVLHKIRLRNASAHPLTTAPALLLNGDRVLGQGTMTYTAPGADADLTLTAAVDIPIKKTEKETTRSADALEIGGYKYARVDLAGTIRLTNHKKEAVRLEVNRYVLGSVNSADNNGVISRINLLEDPEALADAASGRSSWPSWWSQVNGVGRITWKLDLPPGKSIDLNYTWHYFWR